MNKFVSTFLVALAVLALAAASASAKAKPLPNLVVDTMEVPSIPLSHSATQHFQLWTHNTGKAKAAKSTTVFYLSTDKIITDADFKFALDLPVKKLKPGEQIDKPRELLAPLLAPVGKYFFAACADGYKKIKESKEKDNCFVAPIPVQVSD